MERMKVARVGSRLAAAGVEFDAGPGGLLPNDLVRALALPESARLRSCLACGLSFIGHHSAAYCSEACADVVRVERQATANERRAESRQVARLSCCQVCGKSFVPQRKGAVACSAKCRQKGYRRRQEAAKAVIVRDTAPPVASPVRQGRDDNAPMTAEESSRLSMEGMKQYLDSQSKKPTLRADKPALATGSLDDLLREYGPASCK